MEVLSPGWTQGTAGRISRPLIILLNLENERLLGRFAGNDAEGTAFVFEREALEEIEQFDPNQGCNGLLLINAAVVTLLSACRLLGNRQLTRTVTPPEDSN